jgi:CheY-like chemotaxis protein
MARVLLVEDEQSAAEVLATILRLEGFSVTLAANGKRAIDMLGDAQPELIITDYMMPIMNGIELARALRAMPEYMAVPILMISGVPEEALGADRSLLSAFLRKPFHVEALLDTLGRVVSAGAP